MAMMNIAQRPGAASAMPSKAPMNDAPMNAQMKGASADGMEMEADPAQDPNYARAVEFAMQALYGAEAAREVAKAIGGSNDPAAAMADTAYEMVTVVDEKTNGQVPDELLVALASEILGEVAEIASAAGVDVQPQMVAAAMRDMILRYAAEQGADVTQLQQAMAQADPAQLAAALSKAEA